MMNKEARTVKANQRRLSTWLETNVLHLLDREKHVWHFNVDPWYVTAAATIVVNARPYRP